MQIHNVYMHNRSSLIIKHKGESWLFKPAEEEDNVLNYYKIESIGDRISGFDQRERKVLLWNKNRILCTCSWYSYENEDNKIKTRNWLSTLLNMSECILIWR